MKYAKMWLALALVLILVTGCSSRNNNSSEGLMDRIEEGADELMDNVEDGVRDLEDNMYDNSDGNLDSSRSDDVTSGEDNSIPEDFDESSEEESSAGESEDSESASAAMSTDFTEIGALSGEKLGWGSGGPTDDTGRPNGATMYQDKYGEHGAYFIAPTSQTVYLTFDEGYENGFTPSILDTLKEKEVSAVFFITLDFAQRQPELVKRMVDEGHILGNHSCKHLSFPEMTLEDAAEDIMKLHEYVKSNFGYEMHLFRPPMGEFSEQTLALAQSLGYKSVFWSFAYVDYLVDDQPLTIEALDTITRKCHPGAIYLLHAVSKTNADVLDEAIDQIRAEGYTFGRFDW